jgi:hypothetical protein
MILLPKSADLSAGAVTIKGIWTNPSYALISAAEKLVTSYACYGDARNTEKYTYNANFPNLAPTSDSTIALTITPENNILEVK